MKLLAKIYSFITRVSGPFDSLVRALFISSPYLLGLILLDKYVTTPDDGFRTGIASLLGVYVLKGLVEDIESYIKEENKKNELSKES